MVMAVGAQKGALSRLFTCHFTKAVATWFTGLGVPPGSPGVGVTSKLSDDLISPKI